MQHAQEELHMNKELLVVLVSVVLLIAAILTACKSEPLVTIAPPFPVENTTSGEQPVKAASPTPAVQATPTPIIPPAMTGPASATPGATSPLPLEASPDYSSLVSVKEWQRIAAKYVTEKYNLPATELTYGPVTPSFFPLTQKAVMAGLVVWYKGSQVREWKIGIDTEGNILEDNELAALKSAEDVAHKVKYGKIEPRLFEALQTKGTEDRFDVYAMTKDIATTNALADHLRSRGYTIKTVQRDLVGSLPKKVILELAQRDDVGYIALIPQYIPGLDTASPAIGATSNWEWSRNVTGQGIAIGILEVGGTVDFDDPYVNRGTTIGTAYETSSHPTLVAGAAASNHPKYRGPAYKSSILSAKIESNPWNEAGQLVDADAKVINHSYGERTSTSFLQVDRYFDWLTRYGRIINVHIAGNEAANYVVRSPGKSYNVITVGGFDDKNTVMWKGDTISSFSSWKNPQDKQNEKPELVAVADGIYSTTIANDPADANNDWIIDSYTAGTSFAAPQVTGGVAMLFQKDSNLIGSPEAVKAILIASAIHNIEGQASLKEESSTANTSDTRDGAGAVSLGEAYRIVDSGWWEQKSTINMSSDFDNGWFNFSPNVQLTKYQRLRAVIAWDSEVTDSQYWSYDNLKTDLNLYLYHSSGQDEILVSTSLNSKSAVEVIDYYDPNGPSSATYKIKIWKNTSNESTNHLGIAWWKGDRYWAGNGLIQEERSSDINILQQVRIDSFSEPRVASDQGDEVSVPNGTLYYAATATYHGWDSTYRDYNPDYSSRHPVYMIDIEPGDNPFSSFTQKSTSNDAYNASSNFSYTADVSSYSTPFVLGRMGVLMDGDRRKAYDFYQYFDSLTATASSPEESISPQGTTYWVFMRGDAKVSTTVDITDALFIAQYLAQLRTLDELNAVNAASVRHDQSSGGKYDKISIHDSMFISQMLAGNRDDFYELTGKSARSKTNNGGQATIEAGSLQLTGITTGRIPITIKNITGTAGVGSYDLKITFDSSVIQVDSIDGGVPPFGKPVAYNINNKNGVVLINGYHPEIPGLTQDGVLAYLNVSTLPGSAGRSMDLQISVTTLSDTIGNDIKVTVVKDSIMITK